VFPVEFLSCIITDLLDRRAQVTTELHAYGETSVPVLTAEYLTAIAIQDPEEKKIVSVYFAMEAGSTIET